MVQQPQRTADIAQSQENLRVYPKMAPSPSFPFPVTSTAPGKRLRNTTPCYEITGVCPVALMDNIRRRVRRCVRVLHRNPILFVRFIAYLRAFISSRPN